MPLLKGARRVFDASFVWYMDESDATKAVISDTLHKNMEDRSILQAIGVIEKEAGDVLSNTQYVPFNKALPKTDFAILDYLNSGENDDSIERRVNKENLWRVVDSILGHVAVQEGVSKGSVNSKVKKIRKNISLIAKNTMRAPYCTVDTSIDSDVIDSTSVFGGEIFGFTGSRDLDNLVMVLKPNSMCIMREDRAPSSYESVPLKDYFLLMTITWFVLRLIYQNVGSDKSSKETDQGRGKKSLDDAISELKAKIMEKNEDGEDIAQKIIKLIENNHHQSTGALRSVAKPFVAMKNDAEGGRSNILHTKAAWASMEGVSTTTRDFFDGAFSPSSADLITLLGDISFQFANEIENKVDTKYAYEKGMTIYGMMQAIDKHYDIDLNNKSPVFFPVKIRKTSAEAFISKILDNEERRVCCFMMSATGSFENSHISSWSQKGLELLSKGRNFDVLTMSPNDYHLTLAKQEDRAKDKDIDILSIENLKDTFARIMIRKAKEIHSEVKVNSDNKHGYGYSAARAMEKIVKNQHKRNEATNIFRSIENTHESKRKTPVYSLTLAQTHSNVSSLLNEITMNQNPLYSGDKQYKIECLLKSGMSSLLDNSAGNKFGIYRLTTTKKTRTKFDSVENTDRPTLIVCYATEIEKVLKGIFKGSVKNPNSKEFRLKELLGMNPGEPLKDTSEKSFSAMDYILNDIIGHNVVIISAYNSAARGVNFIVNKDTPMMAKINKKKKESAKDKEALEVGHILSQGHASVERDMDTLFLAAPPYYSEIKTNISDSMELPQAHSRYFHKCNMYLYYLEYLARNYADTGEFLLNTEVDLRSPAEDPAAQQQFEIEHKISLFSQLCQGIGRIERRSTRQRQEIYFCDGIGKVIDDGADAITHGHDDREIHRHINSMSVVNARIFKMALAGDFKKHCDEDENRAWVKEQAKLFEGYKKIMWATISQYRKYSTHREVPMDVKLQIEFYDEFRSPCLFAKGYQDHVYNLQSIAGRMRRPQQRTYNKIIEMMFVKHQNKLNSYREYYSLISDVESDFAQLEGVNHDPFGTEDVGSYIYPAPWYISDMMGNYGEYLMQKCINDITLSGSVKQLFHDDSELARNCFELGDFFLVKDKDLLVIDSKQYLSKSAFDISSYADHSRSKTLIEKSQEKLARIKGKSNDFKSVKFLLVNMSSKEGVSQSPLKALGEGTYSLHSDSNQDLIRHMIMQIIYRKES